MEWIAENWFLMIIIILFVAMHLFGHGHGGHGGHCGHGHKHDSGSHEVHNRPENDKDKQHY